MTKKDVKPRSETRKGSGITTGKMVEITRAMFKTFGNSNELIITHPSFIQTSELAQQILDNQEQILMLKDVIKDLKIRLEIIHAL